MSTFFTPRYESVSELVHMLGETRLAFRNPRCLHREFLLIHQCLRCPKVKNDFLADFGKGYAL